MAWDQLPDPLLLRIFSSLNVRDLSSIARVCLRWWRISNDNGLWSLIFRRDYLKHKKMKIRPGATCWKDEYYRLKERTPSICNQVLDVHTDEVLHVSFSHGGTRLVSCSKDANVCVWTMDGNFVLTLGFIFNMKRYEWKYSWASRYNQDDTLLLVAGVMTEIRGQIAIFDARGDDGTSRVVRYQILCRVENTPYDVLGDWCSERYFLCGKLVDDDMIGAVVYMCEPLLADPTDHALQLPSTSSVFRNIVLKFRDEGNNYLRCLIVSNRNEFQGDDKVDLRRNPYPHPNEISQDPDENCVKIFRDNSICLIFLFHGSHRAPHQIGFKTIKPEDLTNVPEISTPDRIIDLHGHIVGMNVSPDRRYLFVNVRAWPPGAQFGPFVIPPIASEIEMKVVDLETLTFTHHSFMGHKGLTDSEEAFYIYLDVGRFLVASGSEDGKGRIWDRYYCCPIAVYDHKACANCPAFSKTHEDLLVTASDDFKIKVWHSKYLIKKVAEKAR